MTRKSARNQKLNLTSAEIRLISDRKARATRNHEIRVASAEAVAHLAPTGHALPFMNRHQERAFRKTHRRAEV